MKSNFEIDGFKFSYQRLGRGTPFLIIGSVEFYQKILPESFLKNFCVHLLDYRGYAVSRKPFHELDFSEDKLVSDLLILINKLPLNESFFWLGHSSHSYLHLLALIQSSETVRSLSKGFIMVGSGPNDSSAYLRQSENWNLKASPERKASDLEYQSKFLSSSGTSFTNFCKAFHSRSWHKFQEDHNWVWDNITLNDRALDHIYRNVFPKINLTKALNQLNLPVLSIQGESEFLVAPNSEWRTYSNNSAQWTFATVGESSHYPFFENSQSFENLLSNWVQKVRGI